jgi:hypothetical protein
VDPNRCCLCDDLEEPEAPPAVSAALVRSIESRRGDDWDVIVEHVLSE